MACAGPLPATSPQSRNATTLGGMAVVRRSAEISAAKTFWKGCCNSTSLHDFYLQFVVHCDDTIVENVIFVVNIEERVYIVVV